MVNIKIQQRRTVRRENKARGNSFAPQQLFGFVVVTRSTKRRLASRLGSPRDDDDADVVCYPRVTCCVVCIGRAWSRAIQIETRPTLRRASVRRLSRALKGVSHYIFRDDLRHFYGKRRTYAQHPTCCSNMHFSRKTRPIIFIISKLKDCLCNFIFQQFLLNKIKCFLFAIKIFIQTYLFSKCFVILFFWQRIVLFIEYSFVIALICLKISTWKYIMPLF